MAVGIDLGKTSFHLHAVDDRGQTQITKKKTNPQPTEGDYEQAIALSGWDRSLRRRP